MFIFSEHSFKLRNKIAVKIISPHPKSTVDFTYICIYHRIELFENILWPSLHPSLKANHEIIFINNTDSNVCITKILKTICFYARGKYLIIIHPDIELPKNWNYTLNTIKDKGYMTILGNAGVDIYCDPIGFSFQKYHFEKQDNIFGKFSKPKLAYALDEQLLILPISFINNKIIQFDVGLKGFGLYGSDLCIQAIWRGLYPIALSCEIIHHQFKSGSHFNWLNNIDGKNILLYLRKKWQFLKMPYFNTYSILFGKSFLGTKGLYQHYINILKNNNQKRIVLNALERQWITGRLVGLFETNELFS